MEIESVSHLPDLVPGLHVKEVLVAVVEVLAFKMIYVAIVVVDEVTLPATVQIQWIEIETDLLAEVRTEMGAKKG